MHITHKKALIITLVILGIIVYIILSFWVVGMMKHTTATTTHSPQTNVPTGSQTTQLPTSLPTHQPTPTPLPTPTPMQGPGRYACDKDGICGDFSDQMRKYCPKTFADRNCLGMCGTPSVRCSQ